MSYEPHEFDEQEWVVGVELEDLVHHGAPPGVDHVQKPVLLVIREAELDGVSWRVDRRWNLFKKIITFSK